MVPFSATDLKEMSLIHHLNKVISEKLLKLKENKKVVNL